jgi:predicted unusual protein kinase regulating ubiquinone biosynthesis (AarF/ABC1/UbiB family)
VLLKAKHLPRYKQIGQLLWRQGRSDIFRQLARFKDIDDNDVVSNNGQAPTPEDLARDLEKMGPTFVKLGQILSSRADLLPPQYLRALSRLQDDVEPFPYAKVEDTIRTELGVRVSPFSVLSVS